MSTENLHMPGYRVNEYLLVLSPHKELWNKIVEVKQAFYNEYKATTARWGRPHITLVNFVQYEMMEERIVNRLKTVAMGFRPFKVELKDFGSFPSHTIFINIVTKQSVKNLVAEIKPWQRLLKLNDDNKPHFIDEPHMIIARRLLPWQYEKGWQEYSQKHFSGRFVADGMLLLKRPVKIGGDGNPGKYQIVQRLDFMNMPVNTKQGELFP